MSLLGRCLNEQMSDKNVTVSAPKALMHNGTNPQQHTAVTAKQVCIYLGLSYLQVVLGVPVGVKDDTGVCSCEVDSQATSSCTQKENKAVWVGLTEAVDGSLPQIPTYTSIYPLIQVPATQNNYPWCMYMTVTHW